jgi:hypothetical protein
MRRLALGKRAFAALALAVAAGPVVAAPLTGQQRADALVQSIGYRLATGNARFCANQRPVAGLLLQDVMNYTDPPAVRGALGLTRDIAVEAVAEGSPAQAAGLKANLAVVALAGQDLTALPPVKAGDWRRLTALHDTLDAALVDAGAVTLAIETANGRRDVTLAGVPACAARFELATEGGGARAGADRVVITEKIYVEVGGEADMVAAILAHELAHVILGHSASRLPVKAREEEADRLSPWLLQNAGYDPAAAARLHRTWGKAHDWGIFSAPDHNRWKKRAAQIDAEIARLPAATEPDGKADWAAHFVRAKGR